MGYVTVTKSDNDRACSFRGQHSYSGARLSMTGHAFLGVSYVTALLSATAFILLQAFIAMLQLRRKSAGVRVSSAKSVNDRACSVILAL